MIKWEKLPVEMQTDEVKVYYDLLKKHRFGLFLKRCFDIVVALTMLLFLLPIFLVLAIIIKIDSKGPVFYRQQRVTKYGKTFKIHKFRTMVVDADKGSQVTVSGDKRVTKCGQFLRKTRLDETPQLIDILAGNMTFVGTRPEVPKFVDAYSKEMLATLLLPAGVTSLASIYYKDEAALLEEAEDTDKVYIEKVLPVKMYYNLNAIKDFSFFKDIKVMFMTVFAVLGKEYKGDYESSPVSIEHSEEDNYNE